MFTTAVTEMYVGFLMALFYICKVFINNSVLFISVKTRHGSGGQSLTFHIGDTGAIPVQSMSDLWSTK
jgi:hypothetical protein